MIRLLLIFGLVWLALNVAGLAWYLRQPHHRPSQETRDDD